MKKYIKTLEKEYKTSTRHLKKPATLESPEHEQGYNDALKFALDEWKKYDPAPEIARAIRCWVRDNFGESEARDPSYNIRALAQAIADTYKGGDNE